MNSVRQLTLSDPIYNRLVQRGNLRTPLVHATVTRNTGRFLVQLQQLMHLINSSVDRTATHTEYIEIIGYKLLSMTKTKRKERVFKQRYFSRHTQKVLRHGSHCFTCKLHYVSLSL